MNRVARLAFAAACGAVLFAALPARAAAPEAPGVRGEVIANLEDASGKIVELAGAVPARKWAWRPSRGVRSVGEAFLHVAQGNFALGAMLGGKPPIAREELAKLDTTPATPERTVQLLKDSFEFVEQVIAGMPEAELDATTDFFGRPATKRAVIIAVATHTHEHLGQSIAYARSCGVVPPWTAREQAAARAKQPAPAAGGAHGHNH
jgi:uncharacterized damage-inducible protein DinB